MNIATIKVSGVKAVTNDYPTIPAGIVGATVTFEFTDPAWDGLNKTAVFRGCVTRDVLMTGNVVRIPAETVAQACPFLFVGIYGTDAADNLVIPTLWLSLGAVRDSADPSGDPGTDPDLPVWAQLQDRVEALESGTPSDPDSPGTPGRPGEDGEDGGYYTPAVTQPSSDIVEFAFSPSKPDMPTVDPVQVKLPVSQNSGGNVDCLPEYSEADNGKVLGIVNGTPAWIEATINGGGETPDVPDVPDTPVEPTSHGIVWDLVNVTSDNNLVSVTDGASLIAVLTPADGYTLGDVTVTMGGEVLTGVWNAETATVTIASVTGDVVISCVGMEKSFVSTSPVIEFADYSASGNTGIAPSPSKPGWGITKLYESSAVSITYCYTNASATISPTGGKTKTLAYTINDDGSESIVDYFSPAFNGLAQNSGFDPHTHIRACLVMEEIEDAYFYENDTGKVIFAGKNTPYYGMANIDGTMLDGSYKTSVLSLDDDIAQNYTVATTSILGEDTESDTNHHYGISSEYAEVIDEVRTAWMTEYGGDYRKIPIIVTTDQHGGTSKGLFNMLGKVLSMHDVSKIMNLGDTVSGWRDADIDHPLRSCEGLKNWCESVKAIPFSKQLNVFGNHDTWYGNYEDEGNLIGTRYPSSQAHLYQYFRNIYARRTNNNGWFVVYDDAFNVKYVVPSQYEYPNNSMASTIGTKQMTWLISELEKQDGYDVVIVSHAPILIQPENAVYPTGDTNTTTYTELSILQGLVSARFTKTAGTITDSDGVEHSFDFTDCDGDLLCSLHGHTHADIYQYVDDTMVNYTFDRFQDDTIFFALIDRVNRVLNIWKVEGDNLSYQNYQVPLDKPTV